MSACFVVFDDKRFELLLRFKVLRGKNCPSRTKKLYLIWICSHPRSLIRWWVIWWVPDFITFKILKIKHCESGFISLLLCKQKQNPAHDGVFCWWLGGRWDYSGGEEDQEGGAMSFSLPRNHESDFHKLYLFLTWEPIRMYPHVGMTDGLCCKRHLPNERHWWVNCSVG